MKTYTLLTFFMLVSIQFSFANDKWITDWDSAFKKAREDNKMVFTVFTGSDWSPLCVKAWNDVLSKNKFITEASQKFILLKIDIPRLKPDVKKLNMVYVNKYEVKGFPTGLVLSKDQRELDRLNIANFATPEGLFTHLVRSQKNMSGVLRQVEWEDRNSTIRTKEIVILSLIGVYDPEKLSADGPKTITPSHVLSISLRDSLTLAKNIEVRNKLGFYYINSIKPNGEPDYESLLRRAKIIDQTFNVKIEKRTMLPVIYLFHKGEFIKTWDSRFSHDDITNSLNSLLSRK